MNKGIDVETLILVKAYNLYKESTDKVVCTPQEYLDSTILHERLTEQGDNVSNSEKFIRGVLDIIINSNTKDRDLINKCKTIVDMNTTLQIIGEEE